MTENPSLQATVTLLKGAFEIPASVPEMCKKYKDGKKIALCYMTCLKYNKIKMPKPVNFMILYSVLRSDENEVVKNIQEFITTPKGKSKGLFTSDDVVHENAIEMLHYKFKHCTIQSRELLGTLNFFCELERITSYQSIMALLRIIISL